MPISVEFAALMSIVSSFKPACNIAASMLAMFPDDVARLLENRVGVQPRVPYTALRPFEVEAL